MKKISLVTGCAGFIGSHMVDFLLKKNHFVFGVDNLVSGKTDNLITANKNKNFKFIKGDIKNFAKLCKKKQIK